MTTGVKHNVKIRFNTNYREDDSTTKEWRVIVDGQEHFCHHVSINCPTHTSKDLIQGVGLKWHISCLASRVRYIRDPKDSSDANSCTEIIID